MKEPNSPQSQKRPRVWPNGILLGVLGVSVSLALLIPVVSVSDVVDAPARVLAGVPKSVSAPPVAARLADFGAETVSAESRHLANWIAHSANNANLDFVIVDKKEARIHVFNAEARLRGSSAMLLGLAIGDDSVPGIGTRPIAQVRPAERTTPAGRFVAERGRNTQGEDIVWVDYDAAVSIHRVRAGNPKERRLERLATPTASDNRISYGCINVPAAFYDAIVRPAFATHRALVYVLPEVKTAQQVFGSYDVPRPPAAP